MSSSTIHVNLSCMRYRASRICSNTRIIPIMLCHHRWYSQQAGFIPYWSYGYTSLKIRIFSRIIPRNLNRFIPFSHVTSQLNAVAEISLIIEWKRCYMGQNYTRSKKKGMPGEKGTKKCFLWLRLVRKTRSNATCSLSKIYHWRVMEWYD